MSITSPKRLYVSVTGSVFLASVRCGDRGASIAEVFMARRRTDTTTSISPAPPPRPEALRGVCEPCNSQWRRASESAPSRQLVPSLEGRIGPGHNYLSPPLVVLPPLRDRSPQAIPRGVSSPV